MFMAMLLTFALMVGVATLRAYLEPISCSLFRTSQYNGFACAAVDSIDCREIAAYYA
jgi:hypothetical protein